MTATGCLETFIAGLNCQLKPKIISNGADQIQVNDDLDLQLNFKHIVVRLSAPASEHPRLGPHDIRPQR